MYNQNQQKVYSKQTIIFLGTSQPYCHFWISTDKTNPYTPGSERSNLNRKILCRKKKICEEKAKKEKLRQKGKIVAKKKKLQQAEKVTKTKHSSNILKVYFIDFKVTFLSNNYHV